MNFANLGIAPMDQLCQRANIRTFSMSRENVESCPLIVFEDHRYTLVALWHAMNRGVLDFTRPPDLIRFDRHEDFRDMSHIRKKLRTIRTKKPKLRSFMQFVEWDISADDGDWVYVAMELGLIRNVVTLGVHSIENDHFSHIDCANNEHQVWMLGGVSLDDVLRNPCCDLDLKQLLEMHTASAEARPLGVSLVIDMDLDCFTSSNELGAVAWTEEEIASSFGVNRDSSCLDRLLMHANLITIATEPEYSGEYVGAAQTLRAIDKQFFNQTIFWRDKNSEEVS